jgi:hypothetical protein
MDITIKDIPNEISEEKVKEWVSVLVERYHNAKLNEVKAVVDATTSFKTDVDTFRKANSLVPKFEAVKVEEIVKE